MTVRHCSNKKFLINGTSRQEAIFLHAVAVVILGAAMTDQASERRQVDDGSDNALQLQEVSTALIWEGSLDALYGRILDAAISLLSADMGSMQVLSPERNELRLLACRGFHPASAAFWEWVSLDSASSCGLALSAGARIVVPDVEACDFMAGTGDLDASRRSGIRAVQSTPLVSRSGRLLGMISTHWREPHQPTERDLRPLDVLARQAADLIERARAETALRESEQQSRWLAAIVESSDDSIVSIDLDGIIRSWNKGAERIFGHAESEAIGQSLDLIIPSALRQRHWDGFGETMRTGKTRYGAGDILAVPALRKDGARISVEFTIVPFHDAAGGMLGIAAILRDVTKRFEEMKALRAQLQKQ